MSSPARSRRPDTAADDVVIPFPTPKGLVQQLLHGVESCFGNWDRGCEGSGWPGPPDTARISSGPASSVFQVEGVFL